MDKYFDLLISNEDLTLDSGNSPLICNNRISIAQDVKHAIIESGLATKLIAERSRILRHDILLQITILVEEDERLIPGTIYLIEESQTRLFLTAQTYDYGQIKLGVDLNE